MTTAAYHRWGRVDVDGTVYVRTADGERVIGSWQAGSPDEALDFFQRKYQALETEVALLEQRLAGTDISPAQAETAVDRLRHSVADAHALGDLDGLAARLDELTGTLAHRREEARAAKEHVRQQARDIRERIVAEAERIAAETTHWKNGAERINELLEEWKAAPHADRAAETPLWKRLSAARTAFTKRRKAYFAELGHQRENARVSKEKLVQEAQALADSTDWQATATVFRELMRSWKAAGRASREAEEQLWTAFKTAQDTFFTARAEALSVRDSELHTNAAAKRELLATAQALLPVTDVRTARAALRTVQDRWEQAGPVPRADRERLESGLRKVEDAVRAAEQAQWRRPNPEAVARAEGAVSQLRSTIENLTQQLAQARERGDNSAVHDAEEALAARQAWLHEAENTLTDLSGGQRS